MQKIVVAVTGASGSIYAKVLFDRLCAKISIPPYALYQDFNAATICVAFYCPSVGGGLFL